VIGRPTNDYTDYMDVTLESAGLRVLTKDSRLARCFSVCLFFYCGLWQPLGIISGSALSDFGFGLFLMIF
jgi:hypothetical protein